MPNSTRRLPRKLIILSRNGEYRSTEVRAAQGSWRAAWECRGALGTTRRCSPPWAGNGGTAICSFTRYFSPVSPGIKRTSGKVTRASGPTASGSVMESLEGDQALLDGKRPLEDDGSYIALARDGAARLELGRGDPALLMSHPAEQRPVCLPHHGHAPDLDRVLVLHSGPLSESAPSTRGKRGSTLPSSRCGAENGL